MQIEVLLLANVPGVGRPGDKKRVSEGYALNYLFPRKLAELASSKHAVKLLAEQDARAKQIQEKSDTAHAHILKANGRVVSVVEKAAKNGTLFVGVGKERIAALLGVPESAVRLSHPIKTAGQHEVRLYSHGQHVSTATVDVQVGFPGY